MSNTSTSIERLSEDQDLCIEQEFFLTVEGQPMRVLYTPQFLNSLYSHFEFLSPHEPLRRIPVSETGYRSHFCALAHVEEAGSPRAYAEVFVQHFLRKRSGRKENEESDALPLFS